MTRVWKCHGCGELKTVGIPGDCKKCGCGSWRLISDSDDDPISKRIAERRQPEMQSKSAGLVAQATLAKVTTGKTETDYNGNCSTSLELTFSLKLPGCKQQPEWAKYRQQNGWTEERRIKEAVEKAAKPAKGAKTVEAKPISKLSEAELAAQVDAILRPRWEAECEKIRQHNLLVMQQSAAFGMFMGLVKASVTLRVEPAQRGFEGMFEEPVLLALPQGNGGDPEPEEQE